MSAPFDPGPGYLQRVREALVNVYDDPSLTVLTVDYFGPGRSFQNVAPPSFGVTFQQRIFTLLNQARMEGWVLELVVAAHERRPTDPALTELASEAGLTATGPRLSNPTGQTLEALVNTSAQFIDYGKFI